MHYAHKYLYNGFKIFFFFGSNPLEYQTTTDNGSKDMIDTKSKVQTNKQANKKSMPRQVYNSQALRCSGGGGICRVRSEGSGEGTHVV